MTALLKICNLRAHVRTHDGEFAMVDGIRFAVEAGRTLAIVAGPGCVKRMTSP